MTKITFHFQDRSVPQLIENVNLLKVDPQIGVVFCETAMGERYYFVLRNVRFWKQEGRGLVMQ